MKQFVLSLFFAILSLGFCAADVEAKRLGGGGSIGMQRQATPAQAPRQPTATQQNTTPAAAAQQPRRNWLGPVAGLAAGLGLAALASHLGFGEELASFMMLVLLAIAALAVFRLLFRRGGVPREHRHMQYAGAAPSGAAPAARPVELAQPASASFTAANDFDTVAFVRQAKVNFIRLQAAHDAANLDDIRDFTTPEMFAEIRLQIGERGSTTQRTDVVELNAEVIEVVEEAGRYIVSVRFNGLLREDAGAAPAAFDEIWHLTKPITGKSGWVVAGIQQTH